MLITFSLFLLGQHTDLLCYQGVVARRTMGVRLSSQVAEKKLFQDSNFKYGLSMALQ
jgi:hypothetical protein